MRVISALALAAGLAACSSSAPHSTPLPLPEPDRAYAVAAPPDTSTGGGAVLKPPDCAPALVHGTAVTRIAADGVLGLVTLHATGCAIETDPSTIRLVGPDGKLLDIPVSAGNLTNPAGSKRPDIAQYAGRLVMGFAWTGSYCGPPATSVRVTVLFRNVLVPLHGPSPACRKEASSSTLVPGVLKEPGEAVEPAPIAWRALRARLVLPATTGEGPPPLVVVLTNSGKAPVSLAEPCPDYITTTSVAAGRGHGNVSVYGGGGDLCTHSLIVKPGTPLTLKLGTLPFPAFSDLPRTKLVSGDPITVTWSMAGVAEATATAHIR